MQINQTILNKIQVSVLLGNQNYNTTTPLTSDVAEGADGTQELVGIAGAGWTVTAHRTNGGGVVQYHNAHGVVTEVACWTHFAQRLRLLVLVCAVCTADLSVHTFRAVVTHWTPGDGRTVCESCMSNTLQQNMPFLWGS